MAIYYTLAVLIILGTALLGALSSDKIDRFFEIKK